MSAARLHNAMFLFPVDECPQWFADGEKDSSNRPDMLYRAGSATNRGSIITATLLVFLTLQFH
jgi:hypothetical protein